MSKDRYKKDHTIDIIRTDGTLYVRENLNVLEKIFGKDIKCETLDAEEITVDDLYADNLVVYDDTQLGTGQSTDSLTVKAKSEFKLDAEFEKKVTFIGSIDASSVPHNRFTCNGFQDEGNVNIKSLSADLKLSAYDDVDISTTRIDGTGSIMLESDKILLKATDDVVNSIELHAWNGGVEIPYGVYLGGGDAGPVPSNYRVSYHGKVTNDYDGLVRNNKSNSGYLHNWFPDGWVTPKIECAYTSWTGWASARDSSGGSTATQGGTASWVVAIPLPSRFFAGDVHICGINYMIRRASNDDDSSGRRNMADGSGEYNHRNGSWGTHWHLGGFYMPDYTFGDGKGPVTNRGGAYIQHMEGHKWDKHLVIRYSAEDSGPFAADLGAAKTSEGVSSFNFPSRPISGMADAPAFTHYQNMQGVYVRALCWFVRDDT